MKLNLMKCSHQVQTFSKLLWRPILYVLQIRIVLVSCLLFTTLVVLVSYLPPGLVERTLRLLSTSTGLTVHQVVIVGQDYVDRQSVLNVLRLDDSEPIFLVNLGNLRSRVETLGWVKNAFPRRRLPDTIEIKLVERIPLALWQHERDFALIGDDGAIITRSNLDKFADLMLVVGSDAPVHTAKLLEMLALEPSLSKRVVAAIRVGERRWNLKIDSRVDVLLPETDPVAAWRRLADLERRQQVLERQIESIDLRFKDRLIIRLMPEALEKMREKGEST